MAIFQTHVWNLPRARSEETPPGWPGELLEAPWPRTGGGVGSTPGRREWQWGGGFWRAELRDFGHVIVFSGLITQIRHPGSCAVLPKVRLITYKSGPPARKVVFDKLKVLWESSFFKKVRCEPETQTVTWLAANAHTLAAPEGVDLAAQNP